MIHVCCIIATLLRFFPIVHFMTVCSFLSCRCLLQPMPRSQHEGRSNGYGVGMSWTERYGGVAVNSHFFLTLYAHLFPPHVCYPSCLSPALVCLPAFLLMPPFPFQFLHGLLVSLPLNIPDMLFPPLSFSVFPFFTTCSLLSDCSLGIHWQPPAPKPLMG